MLKHILKLIKTQGKSNAWVFIELLIVFILLWWSVDSCLMQGVTAFQPEGISVDNVCKVTIAVRPRTSTSYITYDEGSEETGKNFLRIIDRLWRLLLSAVSIRLRSTILTVIILIGTIRSRRPTG